MNIKSLKTFAMATVVMLAVTAVKAQGSAFFQAVTNLNPVVYYPLQETVKPPAANVETNIGSFGTAANAYYSTNNVVTSTTGIPGNGSDPAMSFGAVAGDFMAVPQTYPGVSLPTGPFTVEVWINPANLNVATIVAQTGVSGTGGLIGGANSGGWSLNQKYVPSNNSSVTNGWSFHVYNGSSYTGGAEAVAASPSYTAGSWYHLVGVFDGVNATLYVNGVNASSSTPMTGTQLRDTWDPLTVGCGRGLDNNLFNGVIDEVAIYTNALTPTQIANDYSTGSSGGGYQAFVLTNNNPYMYWAMDAPAYTMPASSTFPVATNYGSLTDPNLNGLYEPGTIPGLAGPPDAGLGSPSYACGMNGLNSAVLISSTNLTTITAVLDTNDIPATMMAWFKSNPADYRNNGYNDIVGHSDSSFRMVLYPNGTIDGNCGSGDINTSDTTFNDGKWHFVVAICANGGAFGTYTLVTNSVYVDGFLEGSSKPANAKAATANINALIGGQGDPAYSRTGAGYTQRYAAATICHVAFFTNTLTLNQIQGLVYAAGIPPTFLQQPAAVTTNFANATNTFTVRVSGATNLIYQWYYTNSSGVVALTNGPGISGSSVVSGAGSNSMAVGNLQSADGGYYFVVVTNNFGSITSSLASLTVNARATIVSQFPITYTNLFTLYADANPTFTVLAGGASPLHIQWYTNGVADGVATNASFTRTNVQVGFITNYCVVTNTGGSVTSVVWSASVIADPTNSSGGLAPYPLAVMALNPIAYWRLDDTNEDGIDNGTGDGSYICHDYVNGNDAIYTNVVLGNAGFNPVSDPSDNSVQIGSSLYPANSDAGQIGTNIDFGTPSGRNAEFSVEGWVMLTANNGGAIVSKGWGGGGEQFALDTAGSGAVLRFFVRNAAGTAVNAPSTIVAQNNVWYHMVGVCDEANSNILLYVNGLLAGQASIAPSNGIVSDSAVSMTIGARSSNQANGIANPPNLTLQNSEYVNDVAVFNYALSSNQVLNEYIQSGVGPFFPQQPVSTYVGQGGTLTVPAAPLGTTPLSYQWYETNTVAMTGYAIAGQTNTTLVISNDAASDSYYLNVTNVYGTTNSSIVSVGVYSSPLINGQFPVTYTSQFTLYAGADPAFSISVLGFPTLSYQWYTNGVADGGATNASLTLTNVQAGFLTNYCIVTNYLGSATSMVWSASVIADPTNSSNGLAPYPQAVLGLHPIGYWRLNEMDDTFFDGNPGALCHDYAGGNDAIYTNVDLDGGGYGDPGYNPVGDPSDSSAIFGVYVGNNSDASQIGTNIDFSAPSGSNAEFSVEAWVAYNTKNGGSIAAKGWGNGGEEFVLDTGSTSNAFRFLVRTATGTAINANSTVVPQPNGDTSNPQNNTWYHVVGVCDEVNGNVLLYVNGALVGQASITNGNGVFNDSALNMVIGARANNQANGIANPPNLTVQTIGYINDVAVFNYALSSSQVAGEYEANGGTIAPYFFPPAPPTNASAGANTTLTIPATAVGTPPLGYTWTNLTTSATISGGVTNVALLNATLIYSNVPSAWNGDQLELIVTNAYGSTNAFVTLSITNTLNTTPTNIVFSVSGNQLTLTWPADHTGWRLQSQTNSLNVGISNNWYDVGGSPSTNQEVISINPTNGCVFYRLIYP